MSDQPSLFVACFSISTKVVYLPTDATWNCTWSSLNVLHLLLRGKQGALSPKTTHVTCCVFSLYPGVDGADEYIRHFCEYCCTGLHWILLHWSSLNTVALVFVEDCCTGLHWILLHWSSLNTVALVVTEHCCTGLHWILLHWSSLNTVALVFIQYCCTGLH